MVKLIREVVAGAKFDSFETLMGHILEVGKALQYAGPKGESKSCRLAFSWRRACCSGLDSRCQY